MLFLMLTSGSTIRTPTSKTRATSLLEQLEVLLLVSKGAIHNGGGRLLDLKRFPALVGRRHFLLRGCTVVRGGGAD